MAGRLMLRQVPQHVAIRAGISELAEVTTVDMGCLAQRKIPFSFRPRPEKMPCTTRRICCFTVPL
jgi:hypothetical protein